jgi:predicted nucleic acid-binding protein
VIIVIDNSILVLAVAGKSPNAKPDEKRVHEFVMWHIRNQRTSFYLPSVVLGELLCGPNVVTEEDENSIVEELSKLMSVTPIDTAIAKQCGKLFRSTGKKKCYAPNGKRADKVWASYKIDLLVVATAISRKAQAILADDEDIEKLALASGIKYISLKDCVIPADTIPAPSLFDATG